MTPIKTLIAAITVATLLPVAGHAEVNVPNEFQSGTPARAGEVNENFEALRTALNDAMARIEQLEQQTSNLRDMNEHVTVQADATQPNEHRIVFEGVNIQLIDGAGKTAQENNQTNGLGNLIVGYGGARAEVPATVDKVCSDGQYDDRTACEGAGEIWSADHRSGSHNIVVGWENAYSGNGGLTVGYKNATTTENAVSLGALNIVRGVNGTISGGRQNTVLGRDGHVSGGRFGTAEGERSVVVGGYFNEARGNKSVVVGGESNIASGEESAVLGGKLENELDDEATIPAIP
ncbi:hypothetical protein CF392_08980 [Tamilnaduibacter salinus]|uniref:Uncharacterized protein n=1 Tax=Tamilnaduibacter salinus TaxID=1484056 RepID=A0A2A2I3R9_9GAMM|nr:hypothetical protein [Tamilnaduibacter salinus]PAV25775.1 hypothetical protein CF392_08980 [Tamilnaduibacter salinus]